MTLRTIDLVLYLHEIQQGGWSEINANAMAFARWADEHNRMKWLVRDANSYAKYVASYLERA